MYSIRSAPRIAISLIFADDKATRFCAAGVTLTFTGAEYPTRFFVDAFAFLAAMGAAFFGAEYDTGFGAGFDTGFGAGFAAGFFFAFAFTFDRRSAVVSAVP